MASKAPNTSRNTAQIGTALWQKQSKCNAEFFALTYGALVAELLRDIEDPVAITNELDRMGHSMGVRCIEEVLAKISSLSQQSSTYMYKTFPETSDLIQTAFRMFMGLLTESKAISDTSYTISFSDNPLAIFVELPPTITEPDPAGVAQGQSPTTATTLEYSQLLAGMIRGMLEMLQYDVSCRLTNTTLSGSETNVILVELKQILQDGAGDDYHEE
jgi:trafficking protein particle complex subunit 3